MHFAKTLGYGSFLRGLFLLAALETPVLSQKNEVSPSWSDDVELMLPQVLDQPPQAGLRVRITPAEFANTDVFHTLYLPQHWSATGPKCPIIFEYTGNYFPASGSSGEPEDAGLGYCLTAGNYIWVCLPYITQDGADNAVRWWGNTQATLAYAQKYVPEIVAQYNAAPDCVVLCGFSRGAIGVNYLGLQNDQISKLWTAFVTHDHFDGVRAWAGTTWGSPLSKYRPEAAARLRRVGNRPYCVIQNGGNYGTQEFVESILPSTHNFQFFEIQTTSIFGSFPNTIAKHPHTDRWALVPSEYRNQVWEWMRLLRSRQKQDGSQTDLPARP